LEKRHYANSNIFLETIVYF